MERIKQYILGSTLGIAIIILVLAVIMSIVVNSGALNTIAEKAITDSFNKSYKGKLTIESVTLTFPTQVTLHRPALYRQDEKKPDISAKKLTLHLGFLQLLSDLTSLQIRSAQADSLQLHLEHYADGSTNIDKLISSRSEDKDGSPSLERLSINSFEITQGSVAYNNTDENGTQKEITRIADINILGKRVRYSPENISSTIRSISFAIPASSFMLEEGAAKISLTSKRFEILDLKARTPKSSASLSVGIYEFNPFSPDTPEKHANSQALFRVKSAAIHTDDLAHFVPGHALPAGIYTMSGNAAGQLRKIDIGNVVISHEDSFLEFRGALLNLNQPEFFGYRLETDASRLSSALLRSVIRDSTAGKYAETAGDLTLSGYAQGNLHELYTDLSLETEAGKAAVSLQARQKKDEPIGYKGEFTLEDFELHRFIHPDSASMSSVTCSGDFSGAGIFTSPLKAELSIELQESSWERQEISGGVLSLDYDSDKLIANCSLEGDPGQMKLEGLIDWNNGQPAYKGEWVITNMDISNVFDRIENGSNISLKARFDGRSFDPETVDANLSIIFQESLINDYRFTKDSEITCAIVQDHPRTRVAFTSDFLDFSAEGRYSFRDFLSGMNLSTRSLSRELAKQNIWSDSPLPAPSQQIFEKDYTADYTLSVRDISPIKAFFPLAEYSFSGTASGKSYRSNGSLTLTSAIAIDRFSRNDALALRDTDIQIAATYNTEGISLASLDAKASSLQTGRRHLEKLDLSATFKNNELAANASFSIPEIDRALNMAATSVRDNTMYRIVVDAFSISGTDGAWKTDKGTKIDIGNNFSRIYDMKLRNGSQTISANGLLSSERRGTFECRVTNFDTKELQLFFPETKMEGTLSSSITVSGPPASKTSALDLRGRNLVYNDLVIGNLDLQASHRNDRLRAEFTAGQRNPQPLNDVKGTFSIPLRLNWSTPGYTIPDNEPVAASCTSAHLSAEILEVLLPFFDTAEGTIPAKLVVKGRTPKPEIFFSAKLSDTEITVTPTETSYLLSGSIVITPEKADFKNILVKDTVGGTGRINGFAVLEDLEAASVDLTASFSDLLLFNKKDKKDETSFGTITGTSERVRFYGDTSQPVLTGNLKITDADFTLYRKGSNESAKYVGVERSITFVPRNPETLVSGSTEETSSPQDPEFYYTLIDIVQIKNLRLQGTGPLKYNMIFDRTRGEQLETSLRNLSLTVNKTQQNVRLFGSVDVSSGTYRFSNSNFDLDDGGRIVWNNVDIRNGMMENLFGRKYVNASNVQTGERDNVRLLLAIEETLNNPDVQMGYFLNDDSQPYSAENMIGSQSSKIDPNAELNVVSLLLTKQWYIRPGGKGGLSNVPFSSVGLSAGTGLLSSQISTFVEEAAGFESFRVNVGVDEQGTLSGVEFSLAFLVPGTSGNMRFIGTGSSPDIGNTALFDYYGNSQRLEYRITPRLFFEAYRSYGLFGNDVTTTNLLKPQETFGVSLSYRKRFYSWEQFWDRILGSDGKSSAK